MTSAKGPTNGIDLTYAQLRSDLAANATSSADATAIANLPSSDPTNGREFDVSGKNASGPVSIHYLHLCPDG